MTPPHKWCYAGAEPARTTKYKNEDVDHINDIKNDDRIEKI